MRPPPKTQTKWIAYNSRRPISRTKGEPQSTWSDSGFRWGAWDLEGDRPWPLRTQQLGGSVRYPYDDQQSKHSQHIRQCHGRGGLIVKGNWAEDHSHPRLWQHLESYYWDNCLVPQLMLNPPQPGAEHWWTRLVYRSVFPGRYLGTEQQLAEREHEVNEMLSLQWSRPMTWRDLVHIDPGVRTASNSVIYCRPVSKVTEWYYGVTEAEVTARVYQACNSRGLAVIERPKPPRSRRSGESSLQAQIREIKPRAVIGVHSATAAEALSLGCAYVSLGQSAFPDHSITLREFQSGLDEIPNRDSLDERFRQLLLVSRNKGYELLTGTWSLDLNAEQFQAQTGWVIE